IVVKALVWIDDRLYLLNKLGDNVTTVLTGLGIGGIAIALAAQTILGDVCNYFVIFFDKPFEIRDFIVIGNEMGTIEQTGIKTTRLSSLSGEELVVSNSDLTKAIVHNFKKMEKRRVVFKVSVTYETDREQLLQI